MANYDKWAKFAADYESSDEEDDIFEKYKSPCCEFLHLKPGPFSDKYECIQTIEPDRDFAKWFDEDKQNPKIKKKYGWSYIGMSRVVGYEIEDPRVYLVFYDDNYMARQTKNNLSGRTLLCADCKGSVVMMCMAGESNKTKSRRKMSKFEIAEIILTRIDGGDKDRLKKSKERTKGAMKMMQDAGVHTVDTVKKAAELAKSAQDKHLNAQENLVI